MENNHLMQSLKYQ